LRSSEERGEQERHAKGSPGEEVKPKTRKEMDKTEHLLEGIHGSSEERKGRRRRRSNRSKSRVAVESNSS
jgi:hypothetical protein